jgi:hypothetical protein
MKLNCPLITDFQSNEDLKIIDSFKKLNNLDILNEDDSIRVEVDFVNYQEFYSLPFFSRSDHEYTTCIKYRMYKKYIVDYYYSQTYYPTKKFSLQGFKCYFNEDDYKFDRPFLYYHYIDKKYTYYFYNENNIDNNDPICSIKIILDEIIIINSICFLINSDKSYNYIENKPSIEKIIYNHTMYEFYDKIYNMYNINMRDYTIYGIDSDSDISSDINLPDFSSQDELLNYISTTYFTPEESPFNFQLKFVD